MSIAPHGGHRDFDRDLINATAGCPGHLHRDGDCHCRIHYFRAAGPIGNWPVLVGFTCSKTVIGTAAVALVGSGLAVLFDRQQVNQSNIRYIPHSFRRICRNSR